MGRRSTLLLVVALCLAAAAFSGAASANDQVQVGHIINFDDAPGGLNGGEYEANNLTNGIAFQTFCVQTNEYLNFSDNFKVVGISAFSQLGNNPLNPKTAYLYQAFRQGSLTTSYDYGNTAQHELDATGLQLAIWHFQGQTSPIAASVPQITKANQFIAEANTAAWSDIGSVRVLNLVYDKNNAVAQDVLTLIPEPVFMQMGLLMGMGGLGFWRARRR